MRRTIAVFVAALVAAPLISLNGNAGRQLQPRTPASKAGASVVPAGADGRRVALKFAQGTDVRLRSGRLVSPSGRFDLRAVNDAIVRYRAVVRSHGMDEARVAWLVKRAEELSGREQGDANLWFTLEVPADTPALLRELNRHAIVEVAYAMRTTVPAGVPTPDFVAEQGYTDAAGQGGLDSDYANSFPGGDGSGVRVVDLEHGWNLMHEDIVLNPNAVLLTPVNSSDPAFRTHGTNVLGTLVGKANGFGVTGMVPAATIKAKSVGYDPAGSVQAAVDHLQAAGVAAGVILLEIAYVGPCGKADLPIEIQQNDYDNIVLAVSLGYTVVEAAGNCGLDLDAYDPNLQRAVRDSGAIFVGAGCPPADFVPPAYEGCADREALEFSNYGSRLDVQGWGTGVATTGCREDMPCAFGNDATVDDPNREYRTNFGGTSSASAVVAGAAAALQGFNIGWAGTVLTPFELRWWLVSTGVDQPAADASVHPIGPRPNLRGAIDGILPHFDFYFEIECIFGDCAPDPCTSCRVYPGDIFELVIDPHERGVLHVSLPGYAQLRGVRAPEGWKCSVGQEVVCSGGGGAVRIELQVDARAPAGAVLRSTAQMGEAVAHVQATVAG